MTQSSDRAPSNWGRISLVYRPTDSLKPNPRNPRIHSRAQRRALVRSLRRFGFAGAIIVDRSGTILAGHALWQAAQDLGLSEVPVIEVNHLSEAEEKLLMITLNRMGDLSSFDDEVLGLLFKDLEDLKIDLDLDVTGFGVAERDLLIEGLSEVSDIADEETPVLAAGPAVSTVGSRWRLGNHRVHCGDATDADTVGHLMGGELAAMAITDMPYNLPISGFVSGNGRTQHREFVKGVGELSTPQFRDFIKTSATNLARYSTDGSLHYLFMDWRHLEDLLVSCGEVYDKLMNICVWTKNNAGLGTLYRSQHELVAVYKKGTAPHRNNIQLGKFGRSRSNVWQYVGANTFSKTSEEGDILALHPTPKPVALIADAILDATARNDVVADFFLGSGSAVIAAERTGRRAFGLELDPLYVDVIVRRWQKYTGDRAVDEASGKTFDQLAVEAQEAGHGAA